MLYTKIRDVKDPSRGTEQSAGLDLFVPNDHEGLSIPSGCSVNIPSGLKVIVPSGFVGIILNKSSMGIKGLLVGAQVIDSDYRGEIHLNVHNTSHNTVVVNPGQKLVQLLIMPVITQPPMLISAEAYEAKSDTQRGTGGFGSTGEG